MKKFTRQEPWEEQTFGNRFKTTSVIKRYTTEDGRKHEFTTIGKIGQRAGCVLALTKSREVVVTYQFRPGPEKWMYELPGGGLVTGEDPKDGALRELREESGYTPGKVEFLGTSCRDAYSNLSWFYYLAMDCEPGDRNLDETASEQGVETRLIAISDLIKYAKEDLMTDPVAVLMAYDRLKALEKKHDEFVGGSKLV